MSYPIVVIDWPDTIVCDVEPDKPRNEKLIKHVEDEISELVFEETEVVEELCDSINSTPL